MLQIHNSLTRQKQPFIPLEPGKVRMYVCGMTVYDYCHIGHARVMSCSTSFVAGSARAVRGAIRAQHHRHRRQDHPPGEREPRDHPATDDRFIAFMDEDARRLAWRSQITNRVRPNTCKACCTSSMRSCASVSPIAQTTAMCTTRCGASRVREALGQVPRGPARRGARERRSEQAGPPRLCAVEAAKPGEPAWDSPLGRGRPGWHIECSAMSEHFLGDTSTFTEVGRIYCSASRERDRTVGRCA